MRFTHDCGFVADGYERAIRAIELQARLEVQQKYSDQPASGFINRWRMQRQIEQEVAALVAERSRDISPDALY